MSALCNRYLLILLLVAPLLSCGDTGAIKKPDIDPEASSAKAFELFDKNSDNLLTDEELKLAPGLAEGKSRADTDSNGALSAEELSTRIQTWNESIERLVCPELEVRFNGRIVPNAIVTFEPEPFLTDWLETKQTRTDDVGRCSPKISRELPGMNMGYYRVKVSLEVGGKERIPKEYNEQSQLGVEFCTDRPIEENYLIEIELGKSKRRR
ncbi:hypothetical protein [Bythopirellula polymerisocia]|uniref:EF-hand domain-containing protein n=1 Tax=Bythopirellula polymerisocia TaxID=2528003 RepID=A0A5C6CTM4_9BACT|nr:hypothetical protein [Bythopirellula polymerisocia]TWU27748.1 hypothetical protein Pla144_25250 [Bythopirellula polymerisocia]